MPRRLPDAPEEYAQTHFQSMFRQLHADQQKTENAVNTEVNLISYSLVAVSSGYSAGDRSVILVNATASAVAVVLPPPRDYYRQVFTVKKLSTNGNNVTITATSGTIDTSVSYTLTGATFPAVTVISDGTVYQIINKF